MSDNVIPLQKQEDASPGTYVSSKSLRVEEFKDDEPPQANNPYAAEVRGMAFELIYSRRFL